MYTVMDFKTKKELKNAVLKAVRVEVYQPNDMFNVMEKIKEGKHTISLEGPHYPKPHSWYATAEIIDGVVYKVK